MNYLSVCSGVEAATVAWHHMGWKPVGFSEIEKFPSQVLAHHYPSVTNFGDMTKYKEWNINDTVGLLVGGTPCQSFSVAGLRKGLEDPRGNLALTYVGILDKFRPKWFIWENVPGVLSSGGGRDFGSFLGAVAECGYGFAYRVLDAQYFGVPQRRRRVFVVGYLGDWRPPAEVLFESESLSGNPKPSRKTRQSVAGYVESSFGQYREDVIAGTAKASGGVLGGGSETFLTVYENHPSDSRVREMGDVCQTVTSKWGTGGGNTPFVQAIPIHDQATRFGGANNGKGNGLGVGHPGDPMNTLDTSSRHSVAFGWQNSPSQSMSMDTISPTLDKSKTPATMHNMAVRRLTPVECERLQGFPDNYTNIKENCPDGPRYKAMGNSMAVPVMRWIGERINRLEHGNP
jgi:DNA (cytosine-5)-methyltransferase 1